MCSLALLHPWFPPSKAPLKIGRSWVQFLLMTEWKNQIFSEDFNFFHLTESKMCSALLHPTLSKAPLKIGRSWISSFSPKTILWPRAKCVLLLFYILDFPLRKHPWRLGGHEFNSYSWQNEKIKFSPKISTFSTSHREQNVFFCSFTSLISPFESTLEDWEVMSSILTHDRMKKSNFLRRFQLFRHLTESKMCSICSFTSLIYPFESTLEDWEVMSSILTHDRMKKSNFLRRFQLFRHLTES